MASLELVECSVITADHADELRTYFRNAGLGVFDHSTLGAQLARAELFSRPARPCVRCGGNPETGRAGSGFVPGDWIRYSKKGAQRVQTIAYEDRLRLAMVEFCEEHDGEAFSCDAECPSCFGRGWIAAQWPVSGPATARPTGSSIGRAGGVNVSDVAMHALAVVSVRLGIASRLWGMAEAVLDGFYGPEGGGILNIWPLTEAGKKLLRRNSLSLDPLRFLANERADQQDHPNQNRARSFEAADAQARELLETAGRAWNTAVMIGGGEKS